MSVFEFKAHHPEHGHTIARIDADDVRKARAVLKTLIFERRMSTQEVIRATQHGYAIIDAETGQAIRTDPERALDDLAASAPGRDDGQPL